MSNLRLAGILGGFLGSGKTSIILKLGKHLAEKGKKVAIIVNEVGQIGVDGEFLKRSGMNTYELTEGCICCTLKRDLESCILELISTFNPDILLIEPTGIAFPSVIKKTVRQVGDIVGDINTIVFGVVDAHRLNKIYSEMKEFTERQLKDADTLVINKTDLIDSKAELSLLAEILKQINPKSKVVFTSAKSGKGIDKLIDEILSALITERETKIEKDYEYIDSIDTSGVSWFSTNYKMDFERPTSSANIRVLIKDLLEKIRTKVIAINGDISHYKLVLFCSRGAIKAGLTSNKDKINFDGNLLGWIPECNLKIILLDRLLSKDKIYQIFEESIKDVAKEYNFKYSDCSH